MTSPGHSQAHQDAQERARHEARQEIVHNQRTGRLAMRYAPGTTLRDAAGQDRYVVQADGSWRKV